MTYGLCTGSEAQARAALASGFDYVEWPAGHLAEAPSDLPIPVTNLFFPSETRLFVDPTPYREIAEARIRRAADRGVQVMVVGSGNARRAPGGEEADARFVAVVAELQAIAEPFGIVLAPESLNQGETNVGNRLSTLAPLLLDHNLHFTADAYHLEREGEDVLAAIPVAPAHVHVSDAERRAPRTDDPYVALFARRLHQLAYDGRVSIEGRADDLDQALADLRQIFARG